MPLRNNHRRYGLVGKSMIISLAAVLMLPLQPRAQAAPTDPTQPTSAGALKLAAARAAYSVVAEVDRFDQLAQKAQVAFLKAAKSEATKEQIEQALMTYIAAEANLDTARDTAWQAIPFTRTLPTLINEPLALALLDLHIEVRRRLEPSYHTVVPGLTTDAGCAGDFIADRLLYTYGMAATTLALRDANGPEATASVLTKMAVQVACLGGKQLAELEHAVSYGFQASAVRMKQHGLGELIPAFARLVAAVQILILDARKHRGERSAAWRWFHTYGQLLQEDIAYAGWASGALLLWDRHKAVLVGFPPCAPGQLGPDCVDLETFLRSLRDPRALGLGDCALAGMVAKGLESIDGDERYTCPTTSCSESAASGETGDATLEQQEQRTTLSTMWSQLSESDLNAMETLCKSPSDSLQGAGFSMDNCFADMGGEQNPFDTYAACTLAAIGGNDSLGTFDQLPGVPMGTNCGLMDGAGAGNSSPPYDRCPGQSCENKHDPCPGQSCAGKPESPNNSNTSNTNNNNANNNQGGTNTGTTAPNQGGTNTGTTPTNNANNNTNNANNGQKPSQLSGTPAILHHHQSPDILDRIDREEAHERFMNAATELLRQLEAEKNRDPRVHWPEGQRDCLDPLECSNDCTALGQQLNAQRACTEDLLNAFATALGLPDKDKQNLTRRLDIVSNWHPDQAPVDDSGAGACLGGFELTRQPAACGLMLCADGLLAAGLGDACGCELNQPVFIPQNDLCLEMRCDDGMGTVNESGQCSCQPVEEPEPDGGGLLGPTPDPLTLETTVGIVRLGVDQITRQELGQPLTQDGDPRLHRGF